MEQKAKPHFAQAFSRFRREKDRAQLVHDDMVRSREPRYIVKLPQAMYDSLIRDSVSYKAIVNFAMLFVVVGSQGFFEYDSTLMLSRFDSFAD